jgi:hypothetical protein
MNDGGDSNHYSQEPAALDSWESHGEDAGFVSENRADRFSILARIASVLTVS